MLLLKHCQKSKKEPDLAKTKDELLSMLKGLQAKGKKDGLEIEMNVDEQSNDEDEASTHE